MPFSIHDIDLADGSTPNMLDRLSGGLRSPTLPGVPLALQ
jgi:hypothetical protein